jgi:hypothetical protein
MLAVPLLVSKSRLNLYREPFLALDLPVACTGMLPESACFRRPTELYAHQIGASS